LAGYNWIIFAWFFLEDLNQGKILTNFFLCSKFILSEIRNIDGNIHVQSQMRKKENDQKVPVSLSVLLGSIKNLYPNFYDVNLSIYLAKKNLTIIDFRYYPKSSLNPEHQVKVNNNPPMIHIKVTHPPWLSDKKEKFDINWEHHHGLNKLRFMWLKLKLRTRRQ